MTNPIKYDIISNVEGKTTKTDAAIAQSVERILGKDEVSGPNPDSSSKLPNAFVFGSFCLFGYFSERSNSDVEKDGKKGKERKKRL